jgi:CPA2 family monovalent cation:H+ antiporter-2
MSTLIIAKESNIAGSTLKNCVYERKWELILPYKKRRDNGENPQNERLFPGDEICVIGTDAQVKNSRPICINTNLKLLKILKNGNYINNWN